MEHSRAPLSGDDVPRFQLGWRTSFVLGLITLALGVVLMTRPTHSLTVIAALLGVVMIVSGLFHLVRAVGGEASERVWRGIAGVLFLISGLALLRHLHLSLALIGLFIGFTWVIQGISALAEFASRRGGGATRAENAWAVLFGVISLVAGIVVIASPVASIAALTFFLGAWFIVMGLLEMIGSLAARRSLGRGTDGPASVPGQRSASAGPGASADTGADADADADADAKTSRSTRE